MSIEFIREQFLQPEGGSERYDASTLYHRTSGCTNRHPMREFFKEHLFMTSEIDGELHPEKFNFGDTAYAMGVPAYHAKRRAYFDTLHAQAWVKKNLISSKPRSHFQPKQVAKVYLAAARGKTTLPSGITYYVTLLSPTNDGAWWYVRVLSSQYDSYSVGRRHLVSRNALRERIDLSEGDDCTTPELRDNFLRFAERTLTQQWAARYDEMRFSEVRARYALQMRPDDYNQPRRIDRAAIMSSDPRRIAAKYVGLTRSWWLQGSLTGYVLAAVAKVTPTGITPDEYTDEQKRTLEETANHVLHEAKVAAADAGEEFSTSHTRNTLYSVGLRTAHPNSYDGTCGHFSFSHILTAQGRSYCPKCLEEHIRTGQLVMALDDSGELVPTIPNRAYTHDDGQVYTFAPRPVIGRYHHSKDIHTEALPRLDGSIMPDGALKVGFELEFDQHGNGTKSRETLAREMKIRLKPMFDAMAPQQYAAWEEDGSVWFEMVSGYGDVSVHREALRLMLDGQPFKGELISHDGGRCGLHVHLDCPKTLSHAIKLTAFYHAAHNELLLQTVARRYAGSRFAKIHADRLKNKSDWTAPARTLRRDMDREGSPMDRALARAMRCLSDERYDAVNWHNAPKSVEIRIFRGTMLHTSAIACLEFAVMSWYFTRDTPAEGLTTQKFLAYISQPEWRHETAYLREYLSKRGFRVWMPNTKPSNEEVLPTEIADETDTEYVKKYNARLARRRAANALASTAEPDAPPVVVTRITRLDECFSLAA